MNIAEALYLGITDGRFRHDTPITDPPRIIAELRALFPSERATATALGIPRTTLQRWAHGARPSPRGFALLQAAQRRIRLPREREAWMRQGAIVVRGWIAYSGETEPFKRLVTSWPALPQGTPFQQPQGMQGRILDAWLAANDILAVDMLMQVVLAGLSYHAGKTVDARVADITSIRWYRTRGEALHAMRLRES